MNKIAAINGNDELVPEDLDFIPEQKDRYGVEKPEYSMADLFRYKSLRSITIICGVVDLIIEFIYDGTILSLDKIGINIYWDQILVGLVEIVAAVFCSYVVVRVKRRLFMQVGFCLSAVFIFVIGLLALLFEHTDNEINAHTIAEMVMLGLLRFVLNSIWGMFFVYIAELFPLTVSSLSFGWVSAAGTVGASSAPYIRLLTANSTMFLMSLLCIVSILLVTKLP